MSPFELALGVEAKQLMDLAIPKTRSIHREGGKEAKEMAKECEKRKAQATKLLEKTQASYEKQANKSQRHIEFEVGDLMWLNIKDFKMFETLANRFIPKYMGPYQIIHKPHLNVYTLPLWAYLSFNGTIRNVIFEWV
jgi:hypothetical protein